ncbi:MAG: heparan-alpha-glucosaminide N-acetyltransferase domain-containing protein [Bacteroidota bacterium]
MEVTLRTDVSRIKSIDILRGIIMVIMALDHVRDFYTNVPFDPLDLSKTSPILFFTRWITHFCAPVFIFLSGVSAFLSLGKKSTKAQAALFLLKRGLWLLLLEFTLIGFGWLVDIEFHMLFAQVIWAIGCSMLFLSLLLFLNLKPAIIGAIGLILMFGHNALDGIKSASMGDYKLAWLIVHEQGFYQFNEYLSVFILYPLIPWIGVMAAGYYFGTLYKLDLQKRRNLFFIIGLSSIILFIILRGLNSYGDPFPWEQQDAWWKNVLAFVRCQKYPPSLLYLLMTLGIAIIALAGLEHVDNKLTRIFTVYGRVPFFYYICHIYLIHFSQIVVALSLGFTIQDLENAFQGNIGDWGFDLWAVYLIWLSVVAILYFPSRWFMKVKQRRKDWWLSYI